MLSWQYHKEMSWSCEDLRLCVTCTSFLETCSLIEVEVTLRFSRVLKLKNRLRIVSSTRRSNALTQFWSFTENFVWKMKYELAGLPVRRFWRNLTFWCLESREVFAPLLNQLDRRNLKSPPPPDDPHTLVTDLRRNCSPGARTFRILREHVGATHSSSTVGAAL